MAEQESTAEIDWTIDWSGKLGLATIAQSTWAIKGPPTAVLGNPSDGHGPSFNTTTTTVWVETNNVDVGEVLVVSNDIVDSLGRERSAEIIIVIVDLAQTLYTSVEEIRALGGGFTGLTDAQIELSIRTWQTFIERATNQWFYPKRLEFSFDGSDSDAAHFGVPIIKVDELKINSSTDALDPSLYKVYSAMSYPKDRQNPRIKLIDACNGGRDIYTAPNRFGRLIFRKGRKNQQVSGYFGHIDSSGTPPLIKHAHQKLVLEKLWAKYGSGITGVAPPAAVSGIITEEWTDGHKVKYAQSSGEVKPRAPGLTGITYDQEVLGILRLYRAPIGIATPNDTSVSA